VIRAALGLIALGYASVAEVTAATLDGYVERPAADSAIAILRELPTLAGREADAARFLVAIDLEEIGADRTAAILLGSLGSSPAIAPAAFAALARVRDVRGENEALRIEAAKAPWERMTADDRAEAAYHVARACVRDRRYPEVRFWVDKVPRGSLVDPFSRFLLAQAEYAFGDNARAIEAVEPIFSSRRAEDAIRPLRDRTAVMLGEMFIELGLFGDAAEMLRWPAPDSPFRRRIERDRMMLESLSAVERHSFDDAERWSSRIEQSFAADAAKIEASVASRADLEARGSELAPSWPPQASRFRRRAWAAERARDTLTSQAGGFRRLLVNVRQTLFPPPLDSRQDGDAREIATVASDSRFFFAPTPALSRALTASALLAEAPRRGCAGNAARTLGERAAASLIGEREELTPAEIAAIAASCGEPPIGGLVERAHEKLLRAIAEDAHRRSRALERQQYVVKEAIAHARLDREAAVSPVESPR